LVLIVFGRSKKKPSADEGGLVFNELFFDYSNLPQLQTFTARDGNNLAYRYYPAQTNKVIVLLHGSGWHSRYFLPLAEYISGEGLAKVYFSLIHLVIHLSIKFGKSYLWNIFCFEGMFDMYKGHLNMLMVAC